MTIRIEPLSESDGDTVFGLDQWAFAFAELEGQRERSLTELEWDRTYGAHLDLPELPLAEGGPSGLYSSFSLRLPVPRGRDRVRRALLVGVHPQPRRRRVLSAMIRHHFADVRERGLEPVSALHATDAGLYGRFGYGTATRQLQLTPARGAVLREVPGLRTETVSTMSGPPPPRWSVHCDHGGPDLLTAFAE